MAKSADPVQAARKAAMKREAKRNRERKEQAQEARTLRRDTGPLERQIQRLETSQNTLDQEDQEELKRLQAEVANVKRIKEEYIRKHPDQRNFVRGYEDGAANSSAAKDRAGRSSSSSSTQPSPARLIGQGPPPYTAARDPRWSIYYDPVFNPYGAPPPGMPYLEKSHAQLVQEGLLDAAKPPPLPEETETVQDLGSDDESDDSSIAEDLKDIIMPAGPPPIRLGLDQGAMQKGSLSSRSGADRERNYTGPFRAKVPGTSRGRRKLGSSAPHHQVGRPGPDHNQGGGPKTNRNPAGLPQRPPIGIPVRSPPSIATDHDSPARPKVPGPPGPPPSIPDCVVISAEPQLRDFKKESAAFVPSAIRKKRQEEKARTKRGLPGRIDAAPISVDMSNTSSASYKDRPDLLKSVQAHLPPKSTDSAAKVSDNAGSNSDKKEYDRFLDEISDLL